MDVNEIPLSIDDIVACNMDLFGIEEVIIAKVVGFCKDRIKIRFDDIRFQDMPWYEETRDATWNLPPDYVVDVISCLAPRVPIRLL
jgi:hypothetical protein